MKRTSVPLLLFAFSLLFLPIIIQSHVSATASPSMDIQIHHVDHAIQILEGGTVVINDTVELIVNTETINTFSVGFPFEYGFNLDYAFAYNTSNPEEHIDVVLDTGLGKIGFYGVSLNFGKQVSQGESYNFTMVFVLSNLVSFNETINLFRVEFPIYPSLPVNASESDTRIFLPAGILYENSSLQEEGTDFNVTTSDSQTVLTYRKGLLEAFTYEPAWLTFKESEGILFPIIEVNEIERKVIFNEWQQIFVSDSYHITSKVPSISDIEILLPTAARDVSAWDGLGSLNVTSSRKARISLRTALMMDKAARFTVAYQLPWRDYVNQAEWGTHRVSLTLFESSGWIIRKLKVTLTLPEGAEFRETEAWLVDPTMIQRSVYQETVSFNLYNVTSFHDLKLDFAYQHLVFWASFRPTLWMGTVVAILSVLAILWRAPKPPAPVPIIPVPLEELKSFVDAYEEKRKGLLELESLEVQARKGKIPRRRYKVRSRALESRLSVLSRDLTRLRDRIRTASPRYADMMRQIEVAETELEGVELDIRRAEARYRRGEISPDAYHKLLEEYYRRRDRARTTIDGVLLRLREETR